MYEDYYFLNLPLDRYKNLSDGNCHGEAEDPIICWRGYSNHNGTKQRILREKRNKKNNRGDKN
jgi:hypothetical protein